MNAQKCLSENKNKISKKDMYCNIKIIIDSNYENEKIDKLINIYKQYNKDMHIEIINKKIPDKISYKDAKGVITYCNEAFAKAYNTKIENMFLRF